MSATVETLTTGDLRDLLAVLSLPRRQEARRRLLDYSDRPELVGAFLDGLRAAVLGPECELPAPSVSRSSSLPEVLAFVKHDLGLREDDRASDWSKKFSGSHYVHKGRVYLTFARKPDAATRTAIKDAGFRYNKVSREWSHACGNRKEKKTP